MATLDATQTAFCYLFKPRNCVSGLCYNHKTAHVKCAKPTSVQCLLATSRATVKSIIVGEKVLNFCSNTACYIDLDYCELTFTCALGTHPLPPSHAGGMGELCVSFPPPPPPPPPPGANAFLRWKNLKKLRKKAAFKRPLNGTLFTHCIYMVRITAIHKQMITIKDYLHCTVLE